MNKYQRGFEDGFKAGIKAMELMFSSMASSAQLDKLGDVMEEVRGKGGFP